MAITIYTTELTSAALDVSTIIIPLNQIVIGTIGASKYLVRGDGVTQARNLPRLEYPAQANIIEEIQKNGVKVNPASKAVNITVPTQPGDIGITDVSISIQITSWVASTAYAGFGYQATISVTGLTAAHNVVVIFDSASKIIADTAGISNGVGETFAGQLRLYSKSIPTAALSGFVKII